MAEVSSENLKPSPPAGQPCGSPHVGATSGLNIAPGSNDDGWLVPDPVTLGDGTQVQLYKDGEALHAAYDAIRSAKRRICLEVYIFASDSTGRAFAEALSERAKSGVRVYVMYDSFGSSTSDRSMFQAMRRAGVRLRQFHPIRPWECRFSWRPFNRDHRKLLIIDDDVAGMGGLNVGREYAGSWVIVDKDARECDFWRDNAISLRGPAVHELRKSFARTWNYLGHGGRIRAAEFQSHIDALRHPRIQDDIAILASVPTMSSPLRPLLRTLFAKANKNIQMTMAYFAPDDDLIGSLCTAARRGVRVQLMLPNRVDVTALLIAARSYYQRLLEAGVEIYERQSVILHAKTMTIDASVTVIGSANLDYRSIEYNLELSAIIRSGQFGQQMNLLFENDIRFAKQISLKDWCGRPWRDRVVQWMISRGRYLL